MKVGSDIVIDIGIGIDLGFESKLKHRNHPGSSKYASRNIDLGIDIEIKSNVIPI